MRVFALVVTVIDLMCVIRSEDIPCLIELSVDISDGVKLDNSLISKDDVLYSKDEYFTDHGKIRGCICNKKMCIRKCCPIGQYLFNRTCSPTDTVFDLSFANNFTEDSVNLIFGHACEGKDRYPLDPSNNNSYDTFVFKDDGKLHWVVVETEYHQLDYCVDYIEDEENIKALVCSEREHSQHYTLAAGMIVSMPFLLLTFLVYALLPDRNIHGKSLMCYVLTLLLAYILLVYIQISPGQIELDACIATAILCLFFFMVSFFWMNVMCIDIWWTFSGHRGFSGSTRQAEFKRFLLYSGYAWGLPAILVTIVMITNSSEEYDWYHPGIGIEKCWFKTELATLLYFYGPLSILIIINITLFMITAYKIKQVQQDTAVLRKDDSKRHSYENDKQRFNLYLKLMLAMGINWSMEIISWLVDWQTNKNAPKEIWYFTDFCNAIYGVVIFFIFVFKRNIWKLLKKRYYLCLGKPYLARTSTQTGGQTRSTGGYAMSQTVATEQSMATSDSTY